MTTIELGVAIVLVLGAVVAIVRYARSAAHHRLALIALQPLAAALLYFALFAPGAAGPATIAVLTAGTAAADRDALVAQGARVVALPEAQIDGTAERAPDLATVLRRYPAVTAVHVVGDGLARRDRDAARAVRITFEPRAAPRGLVALRYAAAVATGRTFAITGRVAGADGGTVELRDPAGAVASSAALGDDGTFALEARSRHAGLAQWRLRVLDATGAEREATALPVDTLATPALRIGVLGGAIGPELKYLRRHIVDAGHTLASRLGLTTGVELVDAPLVPDAAALAALDLLVADERAWGAASSAERTSIAAAVRDGLGLVLRVTGPLPARVAEDWASFGLALEPRGDAATTLAAPAGSDVPPLTLMPVVANAPDNVTLALGAHEIGSWRARGHGRVALWRVVDSHRLVTAGHAERHGELWASAFEILARPRGERAPRVAELALAGERIVLCDVASGEIVVAPDERETALVVVDGCAGYWPRAAGVHRVSASRFVVFEPREVRGLAAAEAARKTRRLAASARDVPETRGAFGAWRHAFLAAWLALAALIWWLERRALAQAMSERS